DVAAADGQAKTAAGRAGEGPGPGATPPGALSGNPDAILAGGAPAADPGTRDAMPGTAPGTRPFQVARGSAGSQQPDSPLAASVAVAGAGASPGGVDGAGKTPPPLSDEKGVNNSGNLPLLFGIVLIVVIALLVL